MSTPPDPIRLAVRMLFNAIDHQEWSVLEALMHPQSEFHMSHYIPFRGRDSVMNYYRNLRGMRKSEHLIEAVVVDGNHCVCWGIFTGTQKDGNEVILQFSNVITFEDKKIRRRREYHCLPKLGV